MSQLNDHKARAHAVCSASASHRWLACTPSARLAEQYPSQETAFTREGTLAHEIAELYASGGAYDLTCPANPDPEVTVEMVRCAEDYRDYIQGLCTDETSVLLEQRIDFSNVVPQGFGTADCILMTGSVMDVIDYKYGAGVAVSAEKNPQMMLYGIGALNAYGFVYDIETVRLHIFQPRMGNVSVYELPVSELEEFGQYVSGRAQLAIEGKGELVAGEHCRFCPHAGHCAMLAITSVKSCSKAGEIAPDYTTLSAAEVAEMLKLEPVISGWLKKLKESALVDLQNGVAIPGYKVVEGKLGNRKWTDELAVAAALDAAGVAREDYTTVELLSPAAMDKALGKKRAAELLTGYIDRAPGAPTLAPETDKRPALDKNVQAAEDFK